MLSQCDIVDKIVRASRRISYNRITQIGKNFGAFLWHLLPSRRKLAASSIAKHLDISSGEAQSIAHESFLHNGQSFLELFLLSKNPTEFFADHVVFENKEDEVRLKEYFLQDRPVVAATAHLGAWELESLLLSALAARSKKPLMIVTRSQKNVFLQELICRFRSPNGVKVIEHRNASSHVLQGLRQNGIAAFLVDHNCHQSEALFLPFLNDIAAVNRGPALLAVRAKAIVVPIFLTRQKNAKYCIHIEKPLDTALLQGSISERVEQTAKFYTHAVEQYVRRFPEQWFWMHKRWKTRPPHSAQ